MSHDENIKHDPFTDPPDAEYHPDRLGDRAALRMSKIMGTWTFMGTFALVMASWMIWNTIVFSLTVWPYHFDPAPYMGFNLFLSMFAAFTAPIMMIANNFQDNRDRAMWRRILAMVARVLTVVKRLEELLSRLEAIMLADLAIDQATQTMLEKQEEKPDGSP